MKKSIWIIAAALIFIFAAGCGQKEEPVDEYALRYSGVGTIVDTGEIKAVCPKGWTRVDAYDFIKSVNEPVNYKLEFVKGGDSPTEDKPFIEIAKYTAPEEMVAPKRDRFEEPYDVQTFSAGIYTWKGFSALSGGERFVYVTASADGVYLEAWLWTKPDGETQAAITDQDVFTILESIVVKEKKK